MPAGLCRLRVISGLLVTRALTSISLKHKSKARRLSSSSSSGGSGKASSVASSSGSRANNS
jgi:hypothetical protein